VYPREEMIQFRPMKDTAFHPLQANHVGTMYQKLLWPQPSPEDGAGSVTASPFTDAH
jgi:hypothetical protein